MNVAMNFNITPVDRLKRIQDVDTVDYFMQPTVALLRLSERFDMGDYETLADCLIFCEAIFGIAQRKGALVNQERLKRSQSIKQAAIAHFEAYAMHLAHHLRSRQSYKTERGYLKHCQGFGMTDHQTIMDYLNEARDFCIGFQRADMKLCLGFVLKKRAIKNVPYTTKGNVKFV